MKTLIRQPASGKATYSEEYKQQNIAKDHIGKEPAGAECISDCLGEKSTIHEDRDFGHKKKNPLLGSSGWFLPAYGRNGIKVMRLTGHLIALVAPVAKSQMFVPSMAASQNIGTRMRVIPSPEASRCLDQARPDRAAPLDMPPVTKRAEMELIEPHRGGLRPFP